MYKKSDYLQRGKTLIHNRLFKSSRRISTLMIYATDLCDSRCQHCLIWKKRPVQYLPMTTILTAMQAKAVTKHTTVGLEGGEFLLHPEAREIMAWFGKNHPRFDLLSNCLKPDSTIEAVKENPPMRLFISLDGTKETYQSMRGKDGYDNVIKVIEALKSTVPISVMFCLSPYNDTEDLRHVADVCAKYGVDLRVGMYSNIEFFDTAEKAHQDEKPILPPENLRQFDENYDYLVLYNEWRAGKMKLSCNSIVDSAILLPNGDVPLCLNLDLKLGNLNENTLDEILNSANTRKVVDDYRHNCNACYINFHRKYDLILYRQLEKYFPKWAVSKMFGYYQWSEQADLPYAEAVRQVEGRLKA